MKFKFNPLTGEFNLVPDSGTLKQKLNWLTGEFNLTKDAGKYKQIYNVIEGEFNLRPAVTQVIVHGVGSIQLTNAVENGLLSLTAYGGTEQRNLSYTQLEYIQSSGTQYIDTGIKLNQNNTVEVKYCYHVESSTLTSGRIFGARYTSAPRKSFSIGSNTGKASASTVVFGQFGDNNVNALNNIVIGQRDTYKLSADGFYVNDIKQGDFPTATFETPFTVKLFAFEQATSSSGTASIGCGVGRCKEFKVLNGDTLVMDLIPARNTSNVIGMYDLVSGQFFANAGTGTFTAGPDVVPTPTAPIDIVSNNGTIKFSKNMANVNSQTALVGYYISAQGVVSADVYNRMYQEFIPCKPSTTYTLSMSSSVYYITISEYSTAEDSGFIIRNAGSAGGNTKLTITTGANTNYLRFGANLDRTSVTLEEVLAINWQLEQGDTPTPYHPYKEMYIDGTTETIGVNLLDLSNVDNGHYYSPTGEYTSAATTRLSNFIPVKAGDTLSVTTEILRGSTGLNIRYNFFDTSKQWLSQSAYILIVTEGKHTEVCTAQQDGYFAFSGIYTGSTTILDWDNVVIMNNGNNVTAEMLLKIGDYVDEQEILTGNITRKVGIKVLDGTETFTVSSSGAMITQISDVAIGADNIPMNTHFALETSSTSVSVGKQRFGANGTKIYSTNYYIKHATIKTATDFKSWLADQYNAGTPVIVVYPLNTPTTESVAGQTLEIPEGTSTIGIIEASLDNLELEAVYEQEA